MTTPAQAPDPTETVIANVRQLRKERRWSCARLSEILHESGCPMHRSVLANFESGRRYITLTELSAIAHVFGVPIQRLLEGPDCSACDDEPPAGYACLECGTKGGRA